MESHVKVAGHPIHPMLVMFPLGLLPTAVIFDLLQLATDDPVWSLVAFYMMAAGIIGALAAAVPGFLDFLGIPKGTRARRIGLLHGLGNVVVLVLFVIAWYMRLETPGAPPTPSLLLSFAGVLLAMVTGWLGGELVDRLGVGVDDGANVNAPSSLTHETAYSTHSSRE